MTKPVKREVVYFHCTREQRGRLQSLSTCTRVSMAEHMRNALEAYLSDPRTMDAWEKARRVWEGKPPTHAATTFRCMDVIESDKELPT